VSLGPDPEFRPLGGKAYGSIPHLPGSRTGLIHEGGPLSIAAAMARLAEGGFHGAIDPVEGAVWRVERRTGDTRRVDFLAKYVRPDKVDGSLLSENTGCPAVWNWRPEPS
jgi:hypothetical protein